MDRMKSLKHMNILFFPMNASEQFSKVEQNLNLIYPTFCFNNIVLDATDTANEANTSIDELIDRSQKNAIDALQFEVQTGILINDLVDKNRVLQSKNIDDLTDITLRYMFNLKQYLEDKKIDIIFAYCISDTLSYGLFKLAQHLSIPFYFPMPARIGDFLYLSNDLSTGPASFESSLLSKLETGNIIQESISKKIQPSYAKDPALVFAPLRWKKLKALIDLFFFQQNSKYINNSTSPLSAIQSYMERILSVREYNPLITYRDADDIQTKYIVFPLHLHPETATIILGRWLYDQSEVIRILSRVLPSDYQLIVKEHPAALGRRPKNFYTNITKHRNTKLIDHEAPMISLIQGSSGVAVISGTAGLEAILHDVGVMTLGQIHFNQINDVIKSTDISKMRASMLLLLNFQGYNQDEKNQFFYNILRNAVSLPGGGYNPTRQDTQTVSALVKLINLAIHKHL